MTSVCPDCGGEFDSDHGVNIHQSQSDECGETEGWNELEQRVVDREDGTCKKCEENDVDVVHQIKDEANASKPVVNHAGLCDDCHREISGLAVTKRSLINNDGQDEEEDEQPWYVQSPYREGRGPRAGKPGDN